MLPLLTLQKPGVMLRFTLLDCISFVFFVRFFVINRLEFNKAIISIGGLILILLVILKIVVKIHRLHFSALFTFFAAEEGLAGALGFGVWATTFI